MHPIMMKYANEKLNEKMKHFQSTIQPTDKQWSAFPTHFHSILGLYLLCRSPYLVSKHIQQYAYNSFTDILSFIFSLFSLKTFV